MSHYIRQTAVKKQRRFFSMFVLFFLIAEFALSPMQALAENDWNIIILPKREEYFAYPGDQLRGTLKVRNDGEAVLENLVPNIKNFGANDEETGDPRIIEDDVAYKYALAPWVTFDQTPVTVQPNESVDFEYVINVPADALPGGHYGVLYLSQINPSEGETAVGILSNIGSLLLVTVLGDVQTKGEIVEFYAGKKVYEYLPVDLYLRMRNTGNVHFRPVGTIFIYDWRNRMVGTIPLNESGGAVMPESIRKYESLWAEAFLVEEYVRDETGTVVRDEEGNKEQELKINWKQLNLFRLGKYTAKAVISVDTGEQDEVYEITTSFWVIPWKLILLIFISIFVLIVLIRSGMRWYRKTIIKQYEARRKAHFMQDTKKAEHTIKKEKMRERIRSKKEKEQQQEREQTDSERK